MKKKLFLILFCCQLQNVFAQQLQKDIYIQNKNTSILVQDAIDFLPVPFYNYNPEKVNITTYQGKPFKTDFKGTVFFNPFKFYKPDSLGNTTVKTFLAMCYYQDTSSWTFIADKNTRIITKVGYNLNKFNDYFKPFYFKKFEVTNREYREFTNWVRDSIARTKLAVVFQEKFLLNKTTKTLNWNTPIDWNSKDEDYRNTLSDMYISSSERFFMQKEIDTKKLIYHYVDKTQKNIDIQIYPDTLVWMKDYTYSFDEKWMKHYFWHSAFDDYPVVGINFWQTKAFCNWKTNQLKKQINAQNIEIEVDLPNAYEWEYVSDNYCQVNQYTSQNINCINDLLVDRVNETYPYYLRNNLLSNSQSKIPFTQDGYKKTHPADIEKIKNANLFLRSNLDENGISGMGDNVSEWMNENYKENWLPFYNKRQHIISKIKVNQLDTINNLTVQTFYTKLFDFNIKINEAIKNDTVKMDRLNKPQMKYLHNFYANELPIIQQIESFYNTFADKDGQLVRGCNWFDERYSIQNTINGYKRNIAGINAKTFVSPSKTNCLIGFRYVIRVNTKN